MGQPTDTATGKSNLSFIGNVNAGMYGSAFDGPQENAQTNRRNYNKSFLEPTPDVAKNPYSRKNETKSGLARYGEDDLNLHEASNLIDDGNGGRNKTQSDLSPRREEFL